MGTEGDNDGGTARQRLSGEEEEVDPAAEVLRLIAFFPRLQNP